MIDRQIVGILCCGLMLLCLVDDCSAKMMPGGLGDERKDVDALRTIMEGIQKSLATHGLKSVTPVSFKTQVVAGTNYFVKVKDDKGMFHILAIHKPLPSQGEVQLMNVKKAIKESDDVIYIPLN